MVLAAGAAGAAVAKPPPPSIQKQAVALYNKADRQASHTRACRTQAEPPTYTHAAPSQDLLSTLGILRRPATPPDVLPAGFTFPFGTGIYIDYVRVAQDAIGRQLVIAAAQDAFPFTPESRACLHAIHVRLVRLIKGRPHPVRTQAIAFFRDVVRANRQLAHRKPRETVFMFDSHADGGGLGVADLQAKGLWLTSGKKGSSVVAALIPDGVATVESFYPGHGTAPIDRIDPVQNNVVSFGVPRDPAAAYPSRFIWRAADGSVVKTFPLAG